MKAFLDRIIEYLDEKFNADETLLKKPVGHYAYEQGLAPSTEPYYVVQLLDNATQGETFLEETTVNMPLQLNVYGVKSDIDEQSESAQESALILGQKCIQFLEEFKYSQSDIISMRRTSCTPALPYEDGSRAYFTAIRYDIIKVNKEI